MSQRYLRKLNNSLPQKISSTISCCAPNNDPSVIGAALEASRFITTEEFRDLLCRILAEEVSEPGSVSSRAVSVAKDLSPNDLREFLKLRAVAWRGAVPGEDSCFLVLGKSPDLYSPEFLSFGSGEVGVNYHTFGEFQSVGLLQERPHGILLTLHLDGETVRFSHGDRILSLRPTNSDHVIGIGMYDLTDLLPENRSRDNWSSPVKQRRTACVEAGLRAGSSSGS